MKNVFFNSIMSAQVSEGLVRIKLGAGDRAADGAMPNAEVVTELVMPIRAFTDLANATQRIGAELVQRGILSTGESGTQPAEPNVNDPKSQ